MFKDEEFQGMIEGPEIMVYFIIEHVGAFMFRMSHDMAHARIPEEDHPAIDKDIAKALKQQQEAVRQITRFGVEESLDEQNQPTPDYWKWYRWWDSWKNGMSDDEWNRCNATSPLEMTEEQLAEFRPEGRWQDHDGKITV